jgi:hypothetical protein
VGPDIIASGLGDIVHLQAAAMGGKYSG